MSGNQAFGALVRKLREEKQQTDSSFSLRGFAEKVKLSPTFISKMEKGEFDPPSAEKIIRIAEVLGYDADELLNLAKKMDPELKEMIYEKKAMADFLRTASGFSEEKLKQLTEQMKREQHGDET